MFVPCFFPIFPKKWIENLWSLYVFPLRDQNFHELLGVFGSLQWKTAQSTLGLVGYRYWSLNFESMWVHGDCDWPNMEKKKLYVVGTRLIDGRGVLVIFR